MVSLWDPDAPCLWTRIFQPAKEIQATVQGQLQARCGAVPTAPEGGGLGQRAERGRWDNCKHVAPDPGPCSCVAPGDPHPYAPPTPRPRPRP